MLTIGIAFEHLAFLKGCSWNAHLEFYCPLNMLINAFSL
jgi:hypothetical protein